MFAGDAAMISKALLSHRDLADVHFAGSTEVFNDMWKTIGASMSSYRSYPRVVGGTGGKDFIMAHASADVDALAVAIVHGGFEFQRQKCSAASRVYVPKSLWKGVRDRAVAMIDDIRMGDVQDFRNFMGAVTTHFERGCWSIPQTAGRGLLITVARALLRSNCRRYRGAPNPIRDLKTADAHCNRHLTHD